MFFAYKTKDIDGKKFCMKNIDIRNIYNVRRRTLKSIY